MTHAVASRAQDVRHILPAETRRRQLMDAAAFMFSTKGYDATRIADIVERAGVAQGTFYLHFDSKEAIYLTLTESLSAALFAAVLAAVGRAGSIVEALEAGIHASFQTMLEHRDMLRLITRSPLLVTVREQNKHLNEDALASMADRLRAAIVSGEIAAGIDADVAIRLIHGAITYIAHHYLEATPEVRQKVEGQTLAFAKRALGLAG